ncbi:hypothetical protein AB0C65_35600 [Nocardia sp. NPDC048505]|uniref:hypothetical protein n=1 Tax=Nocardia sp. NPDC048505 TaxID=3155756 RepID=UPI0033D7DC0F
MTDPAMPMSNAGDLVLMTIQDTAQRVRAAHRRSAEALEAGRPAARGDAAEAMQTATAAAQLEALIVLAEGFIGAHEEMGITRARLHDALTSDAPPAMFGLD